MPRPPARTDDPPSVVAARQLAEEARHGPARRPARWRRPTRPWAAAGRGRAGDDGDPGTGAGPAVFRDSRGM
jgi:hypothetical protein